MMVENNLTKIINQYSDDCIQCGVCLNSCDLINELGITPGEIARAFLENQVSDDIRNAVLRCDLCGLCGVGCLVNLLPPDFIVAARESLINSGRMSLEDYQSMLVDQDWNFFTLYRDTYGVSYQDLESPNYDTLFFPGCTLASYSPELTRAVYGWLSEQGMNLGFSDLCCGKPLSSIGLTNRTHRLHHYISQQMQNAGAKSLVTACPNCLYHLKGFLPGIEVISLYDLMIEKGLNLKGEKRLSIHDSCPDRFDLGVGDDIRRLLAGYDHVEMEHSGSNTICCGSGGIVSMIDPELCEERARRRMEEWEVTQTDHCVTACMACAHRLARASQPGNVIHVLELMFNIQVGYGQIDQNAQAMWEGEKGKINLDRLSQARLITNLSEASQ